MYIFRKFYILLRHEFKVSGELMFHNCLMEVGQGNAKIHTLDQFFAFRQSRLIGYIEMVAVPIFANTPRLCILCRGGQPHHFQRDGVVTGHVFGKRCDKILLKEQALPRLS